MVLFGRQRLVRAPLMIAVVLGIAGAAAKATADTAFVVGTVQVGPSTAVVAADVENDLAAVLSYLGLKIIDLTGVENGVQPTAFPVDFGGMAINMALADGLLYLLDWDPDSMVLEIMDVSDPQDVRTLSSLPLPGQSSFVGGIAVSGSLLYVGGTSAGLLVIDVSNPAAPSLVRAVPVSDPIAEIVVSPTAQILFSSGVSFDAFEITNPSNPTRIYGWSSSLVDLEATEGGFVAAGELGKLVAHEVTLSPLAVQEERHTFMASHYVVASDATVVTGKTDQVWILDLSDIAEPVFVQSVPVTGIISAMAEDRGLVFVAGSSGLLTIIDLGLSAPGGWRACGLLGIEALLGLVPLALLRRRRERRH